MSAVPCRAVMEMGNCERDKISELADERGKHLYFNLPRYHLAEDALRSMQRMALGDLPFSDSQGVWGCGCECNKGLLFTCVWCCFEDGL